MLFSNQRVAFPEALNIKVSSGEIVDDVSLSNLVGMLSDHKLC